MSLALSFLNDIPVITVEGESAPKDIEEALSSVINDNNAVNSLLLVDARQATNTATNREIHEIVNIYNSMPFKRIAIAVKEPSHHSMASMFAAYSEVYNKQEVSVFYDLEEALIWLSK